MKPFIGCLALACLGQAGILHSQTSAGGAFVVPSSVIAGGGQASRSTDDRFSLRGTIGQTAAVSALVSGDGRFSLEPGFWHGITVVPTPDGPALTIRRGLPGTMILAWPKSATGFILQETADLQIGNWKTTLVRVVDTAEEHTVIVPVGGMRCYRLMKP